jgi:hypothetical protein
MKLIFFVYGFEVSEIHNLFMKFYTTFDKEENMTFDIDELTQCFEIFASEDMLGRKEFIKIIDEIGASTADANKIPKGS